MSELRTAGPRRTRGLALLATLGLVAALTACGGPSAPGDTTDPMVRVTSPTTSDSATYELAGVAFDNVAVDSLAYSLDGGEEQPLTLDGGDFSVSLTLADGDNIITVNATDAAGNVGSDSLTVTYTAPAEPPAPPAPPSGVSSTDDIAERGDTVTVSGSNFGDSGTVTVGGIEATVTSWSDSQLEFTVPATAPGGPQEVVVETAGGTTSLDLFVGIDYPVGTLEDLVGLGLPAGTAVRLEAGTYSQTSMMVVLEGLSLYGQGPDETILTSDPGQMLGFVVDGSEAGVVDGLEIRASLTTISSSAPGSVVGASSIGGGDLTSLLAQVAADQDGLSTLGAGTGDFTMSNVHIVPQSMGTMVGLVTAMPTESGTGTFYLGSLHLADVEIDALGSVIGLMMAGNLTIENSEIDADVVLVGTARGDLSITGSELTNRSDGSILYGGDLQLLDSTIESHADGEFLLAPLEMMSGGLPIVAAGTMTATGNTIRILNDDPAAFSTAGRLQVMGGMGLNIFSNNAIVADAGLSLGVIAGNLDVNGNDIRLGHADIASSPLMLGQLSNSFSFIDFRDNKVNWAMKGGLEIHSPVGVNIDGNTLNGGDGQALYIEEDSPAGDLDVTVSGNTFSGFQSAVFLSLDGPAGQPGNITITGNDFDFVVDTPGDAAYLVDVVNIGLDLNGNRWDGEDAATVNGLIMRLGATPADMGEITLVNP